MEKCQNTSSLNEKSYISPLLSNNHQDDSCKLFENFNKISIIQQNPQPFDPNCLTKQYNVIVEGVVFDVFNLNDIQNQIATEKIESEE